MAGRERVEFDIIGRDAGGSKAFRDVGDAAEKAGDQVEDSASQYRGLAHEIEQVEDNVRRLAAEIDKTGNKELFGDLRKQQAELRKLGRIRDLLPDMRKEGDEAAKGFGASFVARIGPLLASAPVGPAGVAMGGTLAAALAPTLAAGVAGAVAGGVGAGGVIGGVALAARDERVKTAGAALGQFIIGDLEQRASAFVPVVLDGISDIRAGWQSMGPDLSRIFESDRFVEPLVDGAIAGAQRLVAGVADVMDNADPAVDALSRSFDELGDAAGDTLSLLAEDADEGASAIDDLTLAVSSLVRVSGQLVHFAAGIKGATDELDVLLDKGRYWIEDNSYLAEKLRAVGIQLDFTADGFAVGSKEAEAYRQATLGTATAQDFAILKAAGWTDAQIAAADASGTYRGKADEAKGATDLLAGGFSDGSQSVEEFTSKLENLNDAVYESQNRAINSEQANIRLEEAIDRAGEAAKRGKEKGIDPNTEAGRKNRQALLGVADAAIAAADDILRNTGSHELAAKATERGRKKFLEAADAMGVEKGQAIELANKLFGIPDEVDTKADFHPDNKGVRDWKNTLSGIPRSVFIRAEFDLINNADVAMALRLGRLSKGGPVRGPGPKGVDSQPYLLAPGEHVLSAREVDALGGHQAVEQLRAAARGDRTALPALAASGSGSPAGRGGGFDESRLADAIARAMGRMTLRIDDRTGNYATLLSRGDG